MPLAMAASRGAVLRRRAGPGQEAGRGWPLDLEVNRVTTFTLDTNCILALDESRPEGPDVMKLAAAHAAGTASVALVAISASERQRQKPHIESFDEFKIRVAALGLGHLELIKPMGLWDVTFWDYCLWSDEMSQQLERRIHEILFPGIAFLWADYCAVAGLDFSTSALDPKWRNAKCDVQAFWSHVHAAREVFVTSDRNFHRATKKTALTALSGGRIETPQSAAAMLPGSSRVP